MHYAVYVLDCINFIFQYKNLYHMEMKAMRDLAKYKLLLSPRLYNVHTEVEALYKYHVYFKVSYQLKNKPILLEVAMRCCWMSSVFFTHSYSS